MSIFDVFAHGVVNRHVELDTLLKKIQANRSSAGRLAGQRARRLQELESHVGELELLCRTLFVYIKQSPSFDAARFYEVLARIDAMDGEQDGKATTATVTKVKAPSKPPTLKRRVVVRSGKST